MWVLCQCWAVTFLKQDPVYSLSKASQVKPKLYSDSDSDTEPQNKKLAKIKVPQNNKCPKIKSAPQKKFPKIKSAPKSKAPQNKKCPKTKSAPK